MIRSAVGFSILATLTLALSGCSSQPRASRVEISGSSLASSGPLAVDVDNHAGDVKIEVDPKLSEPIVEAFAFDQASAPNEPDKTGKVGPWVGASRKVMEGGTVLSVISVRNPDFPRAVDIRIRVPSCAGVRVVNGGGNVIVKGVTGAVDIKNDAVQGRWSNLAGRVDVTTAGAVSGPIRLESSVGDVELMCGGDSDLAFEGKADKGQVRVLAGKTRLGWLYRDPGQVSGVLKNGTYHVQLLSHAGNSILKLN
ncbi:MAG: hypothetical protein IT434_13745 [Phycisphaerales bacterium]|nr:hypothetical protein [Phycisphaerales bacterium]